MYNNGWGKMQKEKNLKEILKIEIQKKKKPIPKTLGELTRFGRIAIKAYYDRGYVGGIISGDFAKGKTSTALQMAREIIQYMYQIDAIDAYRKILKEHLLFSLSDVIEATSILKTPSYWKDLSPQDVLKKKYSLRKPVLIWDDAGVHGSSLKQIFDRSDAYELQSNFDTIRDICSCMIMTVPEDEELMKFLRRYRSHYFIEIKKVSGGNKYDRILQYYKYDRNPRTGNKERHLKWKLKKSFSVYLPNEIYGEYDRMRTIAKLENARRWGEKKKIKKAQAEYFEEKKKMIRLENQLKQLQIKKLKKEVK